MGRRLLGPDPKVSVAGDRWTIDFDVRELSTDPSAELKTVTGQAEIDCSVPEAQDSHEPYESVADGEFGPEDKRKAQLAPLDDLFAKGKTTVILDGQE